MPRVVINKCYGGFGLSRKAVDMYCEAKGVNPGKWDDKWGFYSDFSDRDIPRDDPVLIQIVEEMGEKADSSFSELLIVEVPDDANWYIEEYDGKEWVAERHRTWG